MPNDILGIHLSRETPNVNLVPYARKLEVLYEDALVITITKSDNQDCMSSREHPHGSLIEQVLYHCREHSENINPHIVARPDRNATGIVIFVEYEHIYHLFSKVNLKKVYTYLVYGKTHISDIIEANIRRLKGSIVTREIASDDKYAKTSHRAIN